MKRAFVVNLEVLVIVDGDEKDAIREAMRVAPAVHKEEQGDDAVQVTYTDERKLCPKCDSRFIEPSKETRNQTYCTECGWRW